MIPEPKYNLKQTVYFMKNNKIKKSSILGIKYPTIWFGKNNTLESTSFLYRVRYLTREDYGNSGGVPECLLFSTKKDLIKTL